MESWRIKILEIFDTATVRGYSMQDGEEINGLDFDKDYAANLLIEMIDDIVGEELRGTR